jgi:hypothetical protein
VGCTITNPNPAFCQSGTPGPLQVVFPSGAPCVYSVQWAYQGQDIPNATGLSYQPPTLSYQPNPVSDCWYDHEFSATLTGPCGPVTCNTVIRVYNDNAPVGKIEMVPFEAQPFCPGEDATLVYTDSCAGEPPMWRWDTSTISAGGPFSPIPGFGTMNPVINTNRLYTTTWYRVEKQNGVCPVDHVVFKIEVKDALTITNFTAVPDPCADTQVTLTVDFTPSPVAGAGCTYQVDWYKDGVLVHTDFSNISPVAYTYPSPTPGQGSVAGVYYAVVRDTCCRLGEQTWPIVIDPSCFPVIVGPCYRCDNEPVKLEAVMVLPPQDPCPTAGICTYQWFKWNTFSNFWDLQLGETNPLYMPNMAGHFRLESNCGGCIRHDEHTVVQCASDSTHCYMVPVHETSAEPLTVQLYPNPTTGDMTVQIGPAPLRSGRVEVVDVSGRLLAADNIPDRRETHTLSLARLPAGMYFVRIFENGALVWTGKIVRGD